MKRRDPTDGEILLWQQAMREVLPVKRRRRLLGLMTSGASTSIRPAVMTAANGPAKSVTKASVAVVSKPVMASGLDGGTLRRLKDGKVDPEARLDLHGQTQVQAHARLVSFIHRAREHGLRCVLIITGKGTSSSRRDEHHPVWMHDASRGVLRALVPRWLGEGELKKHVSGHAEAHVRHGGSGAIYVYLRQNRLR